MISQKALKLILHHEGFKPNPYWPGGASGITIGIGYDLGYCTVDQFESDWGEYLQHIHVGKLKKVVGLTGFQAQKKLSAVKSIPISQDDGYSIFINKTIPIYELLAYKAFPQLDRLPEDARGAIVSLVYNRGTSMIDKPNEDRRKEMRAIRDALRNQSLTTNELIMEIGKQIRSMKRLWIGKGLNGLLSRRDDEANLVESCFKGTEL